MTVLRIHLDLGDPRLVALLDLNERRGDVRTQPVDEDLGIILGEVKLADEVAGRLVENAVAPVDVERPNFAAYTK